MELIPSYTLIYPRVAVISSDSEPKSAQSVLLQGVQMLQDFGLFQKNCNIVATQLTGEIAMK